MKVNPVYKRETRVSARSFRLALSLLVFNGILASVALLNMYSTLAQVRLTAEVQYASFLDLYVFVAVLEFIMLIFIMPAITAGAISGERERQTLELMLTTKMKPSEMVLGKLATALSTMFLLIVSSFPILAMVFVYGGVTLKDMGLLLLCYVASALFVGSLGLCCSALFQKSTLSTVVSYVIIVAVVIGTYAINQFALSMNGMGGGRYLASVVHTSGQTATEGLSYLLLLNPAATFLITIMDLTGGEQAGGSMAVWFREYVSNKFHGGWIGCSMIIQLLMAAAFLCIAVRAVSPGRRHSLG